MEIIITSFSWLVKYIVDKYITCHPAYILKEEITTTWLWLWW